MMSYKETNGSEKSNDEWCFYWYCYYYINHVKKKLDWNIKWPKFENISYCYKGKQTDIVYIYNALFVSFYFFLYTQKYIWVSIPRYLIFLLTTPINTITTCIIIYFIFHFFLHITTSHHHSRHHEQVIIDFSNDTRQIITCIIII